MKKLLIALAFLLSFAGVKAQGEPNVPAEPFDYLYYRFRNYIEVQKGIIFPNRDTSWTPRGPAITHWLGKWYSYSLTDGYWKLIAETSIGECNTFITPPMVTYQGALLKFSVSASAYNIDCNRYNADSATVTGVANDSANGRFDVIYADATGYHIKQGEPSASPAVPTLDADQLYITTISIPGTSTVPALTITPIYDENTESIVTDVGLDSDPANTTAPFQGTIHARFTNIPNAGVMYFDVAPPTIAWDLYQKDALSFFIKLLAVMPGDGRLRGQLYNGPTPVGNEFNIVVNKANATTWQPVTIQKSTFGNLSTTAFTRVRIRYNSGGGFYAGFDLDYMYLQAGIIQPGPAGGVPSVTVGIPGWGTSGPTTGPVNLIITPPGSRAQDMRGDGTAETDSAVKYIGTINSQTKSANGAVINTATKEIILQDADISNRGLFTDEKWRLLDSLRQLTAENMPSDGSSDSIFVNLDVFRSAFKRFRVIGGTAIMNDSTFGVDLSGVGGGAAAYEVVLTGSNYTVANGVTHVQVNAGAAGVTITLPSAASWPGRMITISGALNNPTTVSPAFISNNGALGTYATVSAGASIDLISDGTDWIQAVRGTQALPVSWGGATGEDIFESGALGANTIGQLHSPMFRKIKPGAGISVTNTGNAELEIAVTGAGGSYTDEEAQDAAAALLIPDNGDIDYTYNDGTPDIAATIKNNAVTNAKINDVAWSKVTTTPTTIGGYGIADITLVNGWFDDTLTVAGTKTIINRADVDENFLSTSASITVGAAHVLELVSGTGADASIGNSFGSMIDDRGWLIFTTGSTTTGLASVGTVSVNVAKMKVDTTHKYRFETLIRLEDLSNAADSFRVVVGQQSQSSNYGSTNDISFRYSGDHNGGKWTCYSNDAVTTGVHTDSGVTVAADTDYILAYEFDGEQIRFYINGSLVATHTTELPGHGNNMFFPVLTTTKMGGTTGTTSINVYADYLKFRIVR